MAQMTTQHISTHHIATFVDRAAPDTHVLPEGCMLNDDVHVPYACALQFEEDLQK
jgi:hypothetical protein